MKRILMPTIVIVAGAASLCAEARSAVPAVGEDGGHLLRLGLRPGDEWRERIVHEVEVLDGSGGVARLERRERVETVRVLSLVEDLAAAGDPPDLRWARLRRTPEPVPDPGGEAPTQTGPYEVLVSSLGEIALPPPEGDRPADDAARAALMAGLVSRLAPVLPGPRLEVGEEASRTIRCRFAFGAPGGADCAETETARLVSIGEREGAGAPRGRVAVLEIGRRAMPQTVPLADAALAAPRTGALTATASPEELVLQVLGASGDGELRFDATRGVLLSYRIKETVGVAAKLGESAVRRTVNVSFEIERLE